MTSVEQEKDNDPTSKPKKDIKVIYFDLDLDNINLDNERYMGRKVKGLAGILIGDDSQGENSHHKLYNIKFEGKIKESINPSERDKIIKEYYREVSRDSMKKMRGIRYKEQIAKYLPKEELSNKLDEMFKDSTSDIEIETLRDLIYNILNEKKSLTQKEKSLIYHAQFFARAIEEFMNARDYLKTDGKIYKHKTGEMEKWKAQNKIEKTNKDIICD